MKYEVEAVLPDGSRVLRTRLFALMLRPGEDDQAEVDSMFERLRPKPAAPRAPGPYSGT
jgi:hypothetical protein